MASVAYPVAQFDVGLEAGDIGTVVHVHSAEHLPERRRMMQAWADDLDALKARAEVIPLFKKA